MTWEEAVVMKAIHRVLTEESSSAYDNSTSEVGARSYIEYKRGEDSSDEERVSAWTENDRTTDRLPEVFHTTTRGNNKKR